MDSIFTPEQEEKIKAVFNKPVREWEWPRIMLGVPLERSLPAADKVFWSFWDIAQTGVRTVRVPYMRTDLYRNLVAAELLKSDFTHLLMLDNDHAHPRDIIHLLARWIIADPTIKVVGGLNFRRGQPFEPCMFTTDNEGGVYSIYGWEQGLVKADAVGTGSIMIAREVFEQIEPPWFYNDYRHAWKGHYPGEDIGFAQKCFDAKIDHYVDTTVSSPHAIDSWVTEDTFRSYLAQHPPEGEMIGIDEMRKRGVRAAMPDEKEGEA